MSLSYKLARMIKAKRYLAIILILSVILRLAAAIYLGDTVEILPGTYDQVSYHNLALRVLDGHGFSFDREWWPVTVEKRYDWRKNYRAWDNVYGSI